LPDFRTVQLSNDEAVRLIKKIVSSGRGVGVSDHAEDRMIQRDITLGDAELVLKNGEFHEARFERGSWRYSLILDREDLSSNHIIVSAIISEVALRIVTVTNWGYKK